MADEQDMAWRVQYGDVIIDQTNDHGHGVSIGVALKIMERGPGPRNLDPMTSDFHRILIVAGHLMDSESLSWEDALKKMNDSPLDAISACEYPVGELPKDSSTPEPQ